MNYAEKIKCEKNKHRVARMDIKWMSTTYRPGCK